MVTQSSIVVSSVPNCELCIRKTPAFASAVLDPANSVLQLSESLLSLRRLFIHPEPIAVCKAHFDLYHCVLGLETGQAYIQDRYVTLHVEFIQTAPFELESDLEHARRHA